MCASKLAARKKESMFNTAMRVLGMGLCARDSRTKPILIAVFKLDVVAVSDQKPGVFDFRLWRTSITTLCSTFTLANKAQFGRKLLRTFPRDTQCGCNCQQEKTCF